MRWLALMLIASSMGCGTLQNLSRGNAYELGKPPTSAFGGLEINQDGMADGMRVLRRFPPEPAAIPATAKVLAHVADTPATLVGDTLTFPYCCLSGIGWQYRQHFYEERQYKLDPNYEGEFVRFQREVAKQRIPELEITLPPDSRD